jgi:hypothetical protein
MDSDFNQGKLWRAHVPNNALQPPSNHRPLFLRQVATVPRLRVSDLNPRIDLPAWEADVQSRNKQGLKRL